MIEALNKVTLAVFGICLLALIVSMASALVVALWAFIFRTVGW